MRKSIISFLLLFVCIPFIGAVNPAKVLSFNIPSYWEYNSPADTYSFAIVNNGDDFSGQIGMYAQDENGNVYELFTDYIYVEAQNTLDYSYSFADEIQLLEGNYTFFFKYGEDGEMVKGVAAGKGVVRAPSSTTRIPITTVTDPGPIRLSSNYVRSESQISVYSTVNMSKVALVDMGGRMVRNNAFAPATEAEIEVSGLTNGTYIVVTATEEGIYSSKMVKVE